MKLESIIKQEKNVGKKHSFTKKSLLESIDDDVNEKFEKELKQYIDNVFEKYNHFSDDKRIQTISLYGSLNNDKWFSFVGQRYKKLNDEYKEIFYEASLLRDKVDIICDKYVADHLEELLGRSQSDYEDELDMENDIAEHFPIVKIIADHLPEEKVKEIDEMIHVFYNRVKDKLENGYSTTKVTDGEELDETQTRPFVEPPEEDEEKYFRSIFDLANNVDLQHMMQILPEEEYLAEFYKLLIRFFVPEQYIDSKPKLYGEMRTICKKAFDFVGNKVYDKVINDIKNITREQSVFVASDGEEYEFTDDSDIVFFVKWTLPYDNLFKLYADNDLYTELTTDIFDIKYLILEEYEKDRKNHKKEDKKIARYDGEELDESKQLNEDRCTQLTEKGKYKVGDVLVNRSAVNVEPETITKIEDCYTSSGMHLGTRFELQWEKDNTVYIWNVDEKTLDERYVPYEIFVGGSSDDSGDDLDEE